MKYSQLSMIAIIGATLSGCIKAPAPEKNKVMNEGAVSKKTYAERLAELKDKPIDEDPEVLAHFGSKIMWDLSFPQHKPYIFLLAVTKLQDEDYDMIAKSKAIQGIDLQEQMITDNQLKKLSVNQNIKFICIKSKIITDEGVKALANCRNIETIGFDQCEKVTDQGLKEIAKLPNLEAMYLRFMKLNGSFSASLGESKKFHALTLQQIDGLTDEVGALGKLPNLEELKIENFKETSLTSVGIREIIKHHLPQTFEFNHKLVDDDLLQLLVSKGWLYGPSDPDVAQEKIRPLDAKGVSSLNFSRYKISDKGFECLANCTNTSMVMLDHTGITDETLKRLTGFRNLGYLALDGDKITSVGLTAISECPIYHLSLNEIEMTEDAFSAIGKMSQIRELWIRQGMLVKSKTKGAWLRHLADCSKLKDLNLDGADLTDDAVPHLLKLNNLEQLCLNYSQLGDQGFSQLLELPNLKSLSIDSTKVSKEAFLKAKKDYPNIRLYFGQYDH